MARDKLEYVEETVSIPQRCISVITPSIENVSTEHIHVQYRLF